MHSEDSFDNIFPPRVPSNATAYLLGLGPMPPPSTQDVSVAALCFQMEHPDAIGNEDLVRLQSIRKSTLSKIFSHSQTKVRVDVQVPLPPAVAGGSASTRIVSFEPDIDRHDFLDRICAHMYLARDSAHLGTNGTLSAAAILPIVQ